MTRNFGGKEAGRNGYLVQMEKVDSKKQRVQPMVLSKYRTVINQQQQQNKQKSFCWNLKIINLVKAIPPAVCFSEAN